MSVVVVTGASSGIGRALALRAARAGYDVLAIGRNADALDAVAQRVRNEQGKIVTAVFDVSDPANALLIVDLAREKFGRIDVLVNNAGQVAVGALSQQTDAALRAQFGTHVIGPVALVREALPLLRESKGIVFMLGSGVARVPVGGLGAYAPSKAATRSATSVLRRELKPQGIAVTYVDPGAVDTAFMSRAGMPGAPASIMATPEDVARKILVAVRTRPRVLNAVPWQTAFVALAELFPRVTDFVLERNPALVGTQNVAPASAPALGAEMLRDTRRDTAAEALEAAMSEPARTPASAPTSEAPSAVPAAEPSATDAAAMEALDKYASSDEGEAALHPAEATPPDPAAAADFDAALEPLRRRMERVRLSERFVRDLLHADAVLDAHEVALQWAGMPNKNERAATVEVLDALSDAGFLQRDAGRYRVLRVPG
ncbi:MAG: SDR family NAD(P)-dependent oxidoreductase [Candidatus Eremiobacteraeota bacterium]|nr:SDR family NAD(P)-dependent oxidoreductase [Candidatus Eremiobacteraeota bacterium]